MTEDQIKHMVGRFLAWRLPENFNPDGGISFKAAFNEHTAHPMKHEPSGTNLFDAMQAEEMVRNMLVGMPERGVEIDFSADIEGKSVIVIPHGPIGEKARQTLGCFAPVVMKLIESGLVVNVHYNIDTDTIEMDAKL
ncbi:hypothetical protein [Mesorhizobium captivum]|uniref:hypothetical protein n=1 Tax=Mesorhizobium captivum TaxID=3072319 RepID=UPI002A24454A|nr:hypothetical protein [Mesorhizobium sp. VK23E]MDX8513534.1 hypothetical protein [Mesorhizobium sp. VK23E]